MGWRYLCVGRPAWMERGEVLGNPNTEWGKMWAHVGDPKATFRGKIGRLRYVGRRVDLGIFKLFFLMWES